MMANFSSKTMETIRQNFKVWKGKKMSPQKFYSQQQLSFKTEAK